MIVFAVASTFNTITLPVLHRFSKSATNHRGHEGGHWSKEQAIQLKLNLGRPCPPQRTSLLKEAVPHLNSDCSLGVVW